MFGPHLEPIFCSKLQKCFLKICISPKTSLDNWACGLKILRKKDHKQVDFKMNDFCFILGSIFGKKKTFVCGNFSEKAICVENNRTIGRICRGSLEIGQCFYRIIKKDKQAKEPLKSQFNNTNLANYRSSNVLIISFLGDRLKLKVKNLDIRLSGTYNWIKIIKKRLSRRQTWRFCWITW